MPMIFNWQSWPPLIISQTTFSDVFQKIHDNQVLQDTHQDELNYRSQIYVISFAYVPHD